MYRSKIRLVEAIVLLAGASIFACFGDGEGLAGDIEKQLVHLEELWNTGKTNAYYEGAWNTTKQICGQELGSASDRFATRLLANLLSKSSLGIGDHGFDLPAMRHLAGSLIASDTSSFLERKDHVLLISMVMGNARKERIANFEWLTVYANVSPPLGLPGWSGMDPKAISDPEARALYEAAMRKNARNNLTNCRQTGLSRIEAERPLALAYVIDTFKDTRHSPILLEICKTLLCADEEERKEIDEQLRRTARAGDVSQ